MRVYRFLIIVYPLSNRLNKYLPESPEVVVAVETFVGSAAVNVAAQTVGATPGTAASLRCSSPQYPGQLALRCVDCVGVQPVNI